MALDEVFAYLQQCLASGVISIDTARNLFYQAYADTLAAEDWPSMDVDDDEQLDWMGVAVQPESEVEAKVPIIFYWKTTEFNDLIQN